jgi:RNA polymerase sigma factor (sigma-70 family)
VINSKRKSASSKALINALNRLPSRQKEAILLKYFNGMGYDEIEMIMNINYQTARNYVSSGVQNLKIVLKEKSESPISYIFSV